MLALAIAIAWHPVPLALIFDAPEAVWASLVAVPLMIIRERFLRSLTLPAPTDLPDFLAGSPSPSGAGGAKPEGGER